jgi:Ca2+-binding RTX toxin-like protein
MYAQREFDAVWAAMQQNQVLYGIDPTQQFNLYTYTRMQATLQDNPILKELAIQGHGVNSPPSTKYDGFTTDFQNRTDGVTYYVGGGTENGTLAISSFFDDEILTHAPFATAEQNGTLEQTNQNGTIESSLAVAIAASNAVDFNRVYVASDFSTNAAAVGAVQMVPNVAAAPAMPTAPTPVVAPSAVVQAGTTLLVGGSGNTVTVPTGGSVTTAGAGPNTLNLGGGSETVVSNGADTIMGGSGTASITINSAATVVGGSGALMVQGGSGASTAYAGSGGLTYQGGSGADTVVGNGNTLRATAGTGGGVFFGGGNAIITAGAGGPVNVEIGGNGDQLIGAGPEGVLFGASGGAVSMSSLADTGNSVFFGASGSGAMRFVTGAGADMLALGQGTNTVTLGSGRDVIFGNGGTTSVSTITAGSGSLDLAFSGASTDLVIAAQPGAARDFNLYLYSPGADKITLQGYSATQAATALATQTHSAGGTQLSLSDGSVISLLGVGLATSALFG